MISACIVGRDNDKYIRNCFESVRDIVDEVVYLDTGSTDTTLAIAKEYADKTMAVAPSEYNWSLWRNTLIKEATQEWILSIDTDEVATDMLRDNLRNYIKSLPDNIHGVRFKRADLVTDLEHFVSVPGEHCYMSHPWIYKKDGAKWVNKVHEIYTGAGDVKDWDIIGIVHYNMLLTDRLRRKSHPQYGDKEKYSDEFILKQWKRKGLIKKLPPEVTWKEKVKYGTDFS